MFQSLGRYIYDRRRGLFKTAGVIGTLYVSGKYILQRLEEVKESVLTERGARENLRKRFQQNMQDCTFTIMAYMPTLASRILEELDVERISLELQNRSKKQVVPISQPQESSAEAAPPPRLDRISSESDVPTTTSEEASAPSSQTHLSASLVSAVELEASSPVSSFSNLSERDASNSQSVAPSFASPSIGQAASDDQNTSSYLSNMESSDPLSSSLPLSSNPLADSEISWVQFRNNQSTENDGGNPTDFNSSAEHKTDAAPEDNLPVIPDLELPTLDLSSVSIVDTQSAAGTQASDRVQPNNGGSAMSHIGDSMDTRDGMGSLALKTKAELWHELKIMSFTRVLVVLYSTTLLSLQIHVQLNLIGRYKYVQSVRELEIQERQREKEQQSELGADLFDSLGLVGSFVHSVAPALSSALGSNYSSLPEEETLESEDLLDDDIERKYLTLSWWLLHIGWRDVASRVRAAAEDILQGVSLKSRLSMNDLRDLLAQMRKQIEFLPDSSTRSDITSAIFPLSPSAEQNVLIQGGISPHLATIDPPLRHLLNETRAYVNSPDFNLVWGMALDKGFDTILSGLEREIFGDIPSLQEVDGASQEEGERRERLAGMLPGLARWCHPALYGIPNELVEGLATMRELAGMSAIVFSSYEEDTVM
ncbi:hypothetical protein CPB86DRAFT_805263 [Serendipita vermifera]|nr:hypothetical protein CPB86DRAFT_805263 [Serendipita vermifera]